jgi:hypothetical protein
VRILDFGLARGHRRRRRRRAPHQHRDAARDPGLHEPRAGAQRQGGGAPDRPLGRGHHALRDARGRAPPTSPPTSSSGCPRC